MADFPEQQQQTETTPNDTNPLLSLFSNFLKLLNSLLPPPAPPKSSNELEENSNASAPTQPGPVPAGEVSEEPSIVRFPEPAEKEVPRLTLEGDESPERSNSGSAVVWPVYALGGFLILRWAWKRWNEHKGRKKPSDEDPPPTAE